MTVPIGKPNAGILLACVSFGLALATTGCLHPKVGPQSLPRDRELYSISLGLIPGKSKRS